MAKCPLDDPGFGDLGAERQLCPLWSKSDEKWFFERFSLRHLGDVAVPKSCDEKNVRPNAPPLSALCNQKNLLRSQHAWSTSCCALQNSTCFARVITNNKGNDLTFVDERHTEHERVSHRPPLSSVEQAKKSAAQPQVHEGSLVSHELTQPTCRSRSVGRRDGGTGSTG